MVDGLLLLRADGGAGIGNGHIMRCLALGESWIAGGGEAALASAGLSPDLQQRAREAGLDVIGIDPGPSPLERLVAERRPIWTVLDGYGFGVDLQRAAHASGSRVAVIDDHRRVGSYDADLVVDQNLGVVAGDYRSVVGESTKVLAGPRFVLLRRRFLALEPRPIEPAVRRAVVSLGGSPPAAAAVLVRKAAAELGLEDRTTFLVGGAPVTDMASLLRDVDLAITAAGTTVWELCYFGVPMVLLPIADNQVPVAAAMAGIGAAVAVAPDALAGDLVDATRPLLDDAALRISLSSRARRLVDGRGASRVVAAMRSAGVVLRPADRDDTRRLFEWANDTGTRTASFNTAPIAWEEHVRWLEQRLADGESRILMASDELGDVGQFRAQREGREATVGVVVAPSRRGRGLGTALVLAASELLLADGWADVLHAWVKPSNVSSQLAFLDAGYLAVEAPGIGGPDRLHYALHRST